MDQRCKAELKSSYVKCQKEQENITTLISEILHTQKLLLDKIDLYTEAQIEQNRNVILNSTQLNYMLFNKLFAFMIDLESFCKGYKAHTLRNIDRCHVDEEMKAISAAQESPLMTSGVSAASIYPSNDTISTTSYQGSGGLDPLVPEFCPGRPPSENIYHENNQNSMILKPTYVHLPLENGVTGSTSSNSSTSINNELPDSNVPLQSEPEYFQNEEDEEDQLPDSVSQTGSDTEVKCEFKTERSSPKKSTEAVFSKNKPMGRFERKFEHVKTEIPDLAFVREDSSSDYYSVPDRNPSYTNLNVEKVEKESQAKNKQNPVKQEVLKKDPKENYEEIREHDLPNIFDLGIITYVHDVSEFYFSMLQDNLQLVIEEQLVEYAKLQRKGFKNKLDAKLAIGKYCIALSEQYNTWNRAEVLEWKMTDPDNVDVQFVDYGEYASVKYQHLIPIPKVFCKVPKQTIRCCLSSVEPIGDLRKWSKTAYDDFLGLCYDGAKMVHIRITSIEQQRRRIAIDFCRLDDDEQTTLTCCEMMIIKGHARLVKESQQRDEQNQQQSSRNFMIDQIKHAQGLGGISEQDDAGAALDKFCNDMPVTHATMADALMGYNAQDDLRLCRFARPDGTCFKGARCRLEHTRRRKNGVTTDTEDVFMAPENTFLPSESEILSVIVTYFKSPSLIYGQVKHAGNNNGGVVKDMFKLMNKTQMTKTYVSFDYPPAIGELVIAKNFDNRWYRATVLEVNAGASQKTQVANVFFVDIGEVADVLLLDLKKMKPGFAQHPYQAIQFKVSHISPVHTFDLESFRQFTSKYLYTNFSVIVKYAGGDLIEGIFTDASDNDLGMLLIEKNFAQPETSDMHPLRSSNILVD